MYLRLNAGPPKARPKSVANTFWRKPKQQSKIDQFVINSLELVIKESVTQVAPVYEGIPFLGLRIFPELIRIKNEYLKRLRNKIFQKEARYKSGRIIEKDLINSVQSMIAHVSHANSLSVRKDIFIKMCQKVLFTNYICVQRLCPGHYTGADALHQTN